MKRLLSVVAVLAASAASAQYLNFKVINNQAQPFRFYADTRTNPPSGLDPTLVSNAASRAIASWNAVSCAVPKLSLVGGSAGVVADPESTYDTFSVAPIWMQDQNDPDFNQIIGGQPLLAIAVPRAYAGVLQTCDVFFNGVFPRWSTADVTPSDSGDVETVMLHEMGHCLGLDENNVDMTAAMYVVVSNGTTRRAVAASDRQSLCARYPNEGASAAPCRGDGGCDSGLKCVAQPATNGVSVNLCTRGCMPSANEVCDIPLSCVLSNEFPTVSGACLLPGDIVTRVGSPCAADAECGSGIAFCKLPGPLPSGNQGWADGYCTQICGAGQAPCPAGSSCQNTPDGQRCLQSCRVGLADCRGGYACLEVDNIATTGACYPRCYSNNDCNTAVAECRACDGACVMKRTNTGQIGDFCTDDSTCGTGQSCRATIDVSNQQQCTVNCSRGCGTCPTGTVCSPGARGELFCLRSCTGPGTCPNGLRCADTAVGKACQPWCAQHTDCPVGQSCYQGECYGPEYDAGCGTLCNRPDAGRPTVIVPKDAGNGNGGTGGCGCTSVEPSLGFLALALLAVRRRRS